MRLLNRITSRITFLSLISAGQKWMALKHIRYNQIDRNTLAIVLAPTVTKTVRIKCRKGIMKLFTFAPLGYKFV